MIKLGITRGDRLAVVPKGFAAAGRRVSAGFYALDHLRAATGQELADKAHADLLSSMLNGQRSLRQCDVKMTAVGAWILMPAPIDTDGVRHGQQLLFGVGQHVTHDHSAEIGTHVVDVDSHAVT